MADAKVLIVEDEVIVAMGLERSLGSFGYNVVGLATKGEDAVRMAGELMPDLALIDINLEDSIDGIDVAEKIGKEWDIPVVYLTSYTGDETLSRAIQTNPYGYLTKPARPREIYTTIETVLQKHRAIKAERALESGEKKFSAVMDSLPFPVCIISLDEGSIYPKFVYANKMFLSVTGMDFSEISRLSPEIMFGMEFSRIIHEDGELTDFDYGIRLKTAGNNEISARAFAKVAEFKNKRHIVLTVQKNSEKSSADFFKSANDTPENILSLVDSLKQPASAIIAISGLKGGMEFEEISRNAEKILNTISGFEK